MNRDFKGVWIPKEIWLDKGLTLTEKAFLVEIDSLDNEEGCYATNAYFAEFFDLSACRCSQIINNLKDKGKISIELLYRKGTNEVDKRILHTIGISKMEKGISKPANKTELYNVEENKRIRE
jgi:hypothetical protein